MGDAVIDALVLSVDKTTNIAKCYSEPLEHEIRVQIPGNVRVPKGTYIVLTDCDNDNDVWMPTAENFKTRKLPHIRFHTGVMLIESIAACSADAEHKTFSKKLAYAGAYGFVLLSDPTIERGITYNVDLTINDGALPGEPIFKINTVKMPIVNHLNKSFIERMITVENKEPKWEEWPENLDDQLSAADTSQNTVELAAADDEEVLTGNEVGLETVRSANVSTGNIDRDCNTPGSSETLTSSRPKTPSMNAEQKSDVELTCIVLNVDEYISAWDVSQMRLVRIRSDRRRVDMRRLQTLRFIVGEDRNDIITIKEGTDFRYTDEHDDTIATKIAFSPNSNHASSNFSVGVSNMYGYITMPENNATYETSQIYKVVVALEQYENPLAPIFIAVTAPAPEPNISNTDDNFFNSVQLFEEKMLLRNRQDGLGTSRVPRYQRNYVSRKNFLWIDPIDRATEYKALFFQVDKMWTSIGDAEVRTMIRTQENQEDVRIGSWVTVRLDLGKLAKQRPHRVSKILRVEEIPYRMKQIRGKIIVTGEIKLILMRHDEHNGVRFYTEGVLGLVEVPARVYDRKPKTADFHKIDAPFMIGERPVFWRAELVGEPNESNTNQNFQKSGELDENRENKMSPSPPAISKSIGEQSIYRGNGPQFFSDRPNQFSDQEYQGNMPGPNYASGNTTRTQSRATLPDYEPVPRSNSTATPWLAPPLSMEISGPDGYGADKAIAANKDGPLMIVYLCKHKRPARMMWRELDGRSVALGDTFICEFRKIDPIDHVDLEITRVIEVVNEQSYCRIKDTQCELGTSVNMSDFDPKLNACRKLGVNPIMKCEFGILMIADYVTDPSQNRIKAQTLVDQYKNSPAAETMVGFCRYVLHLCPLTLFSADANPEARVLAYIWELIELNSTVDLYLHKQDVLDHNNLGHMQNEYKGEDDIARTKRVNKEKAMEESRARNRQFGSQYTAGYPPSQGRMSSSQSHHTNNYSRPQSSVSGSAFSGRFDSNRTPVPISDQQSYRPNYQSNFGHQPPGPVSCMNNTPIPSELLPQTITRLEKTSTALTEFFDYIERNFSHLNINLNILKETREDNQMIIDEYHRSDSGPSTSNYRR